MFHAVLVPVDRSAFAERALLWAVRIAERAGAELHAVLVHAVLNPEVVQSAQVVLETTFDAGLEHEERAYLDALVPRLHGETGGAVHTRLLDGPIARSIDDYVHANGIGLVVMSTHGHGGLRRAWLGSVADRLVRRLTVPLLLVRPVEGEEPVAREFRSVLVAVDGSPIAERALTAAVQLRDSAAAHLTLVRVVAPSIYAPTPYIPDAARINRLEVERSTAEAESYVTDLAARSRSLWSHVDARVVVSHHVADAILRAATEANADLIAIGTHGRGPIARAVLGSVADKVIRGADLPVLVVPAGTADEDNGDVDEAGVSTAA